jgi:probable rRNA maturation factor
MIGAAEKRADPVIETIVESALWEQEPCAEDAVRRAILAAAQVPLAGAREIARSELAIVLSDDSTIRGLNRTWRGLDKPTNVLSFPSPESGSIESVSHLGDIVIAFETTAREAKEEGKPFADHLMHLTVHGYLHLLGYDHESDAEAAAMERIETDILAGLGVPNPYAESGLD